MVFIFCLECIFFGYFLWGFVGRVIYISFVVLIVGCCVVVFVVLVVVDIEVFVWVMLVIGVVVIMGFCGVLGEGLIKWCEMFKLL